MAGPYGRRGAGARRRRGAGRAGRRRPGRRRLTPPAAAGRPGVRWPGVRWPAVRWPARRKRHLEAPQASSRLSASVISAQASRTAMP
ncbi:hypothetical protein NOCARDAX2BIS_730003 [Nocardioides sp. AX2bis]|nr:hypothetical protein NOCARDAX2BIS_730003 [Nocardioides sp. AX2bis]